MPTHIHASCLRGENHNRENMSSEACALQNPHYKDECANNMINAEKWLGWGWSEIKSP